MFDISSGTKKMAKESQGARPLASDPSSDTSTALSRSGTAPPLFSRANYITTTAAQIC
jgi:hypothetical protein